MKAKNKDMMKSIKEYEKSQREAAKSQIEQKTEEAISFDQWWLDRSGSLNQPQYIKEILKADAKGRGLSGKQTADKWDWAARQFGLSL